VPIQKVFPVSGKVYYRDFPAAGVRVTIVAQTPIEGRQFNCEPITEEDGSFVCTTYQEGDGLPPGMYHVWVTWPDQVNDDDRSRENDRLRGKYNNPSSPAFQIHVNEGVNEPVEIKLR
jgi:hypothetical protein